ncbi:MAG: VWA domain-containing protein [Rhodospirillales bacterium]|nr:VWA domain-containing protein [Rhodospirillales bacterium]
MSIFGILDPEEFVGGYWHRLIGKAESYARHPEAAVTFDEVRDTLTVFFHGLGGTRGVRLAPAHEQTSHHRLNFRQKLGMESERLDRPEFNGETVSLPRLIDIFPERELNRDLYFWLAAFFVHMDNRPQPRKDPLQADLAFLRTAETATTNTLAACPGLAQRHRRLRQALLAIRPRRERLAGMEATVERMVATLLAGESLLGIANATAPKGYRTFLPVPLWGAFAPADPVARKQRDDLEEMAGGQGEEDDRKRKAKRRNQDQAEREDSLILNKFEKILSMADMVNLNRAIDDDEDDDPRKAADDLDEITISPHQKKTATRIRLDLDLPPDAVDEQRLLAKLTYPEWDCRKERMLPKHCAVYIQTAPETGESWKPDAEQKRRIRKVRRQFEALRPRRQILTGQPDGPELDMDSLVRSRCDLAAGGHVSSRVYLDARNNERDLAVALLVDVSLSTDAWIEGRRVLDVEKEALTALAHGLEACGDDHAIFTFTSRRRKFVRMETVKGFDEPSNATVDRRISALKPGFYTRMGAAVRHAAAMLAERPNRHKLLLVLTDGKPNDVDHYEGRYGLEDTRIAIQEARRSGAVVFGVTVDTKARAYFPHLFGRGAYHIVGHIDRLPAALPKIYGNLVA